MAHIHHTTMTPSKLELLESWLPRQPWYSGSGRVPLLAKVGGFRLDDPAGEVGLEFMIVRDDATGAAYGVPMAYRGAPVAGGALIGTSEHGVLGTRWLYDGAADPVFEEQLRALARGEVQAQDQSVSDLPDPTVEVSGELGVGARLVVARRLQPGEGRGVVATWEDSGGRRVRGPVALVATRASGAADEAPRSQPGN